MYLQELHTMYAMAYYFVKDHAYRVLHINENAKEIWLEKYTHKTTRIIRLVHQGFDWKNHLKRDIGIVFQKVKSIKRLLRGKHVEIHNIYIHKHAPVDQWEHLKRPMQLQEKNPIRMKVYYLDEHHKVEEQQRLQQSLGSLPFERIDHKTEIEMERDIHRYRTMLTSSFYQRRKKVKNIFSFGKPFMLYILMVINVVMFFVLEANGGSQSIDNLIRFGAKYNPAMIEDGEWWRIISSMFLHIGFLHLFMNMFAIYYIGAIVERTFGSWRFFLIYMLSGIGGGLASFAFTANVAAGASGALYGLIGALLFFGINYKQIFFQTLGKGLIFIIAINLIFSFMVPQIDAGAHIGGLITGFIAAGIVHLPNRGKISTQMTSLLIYFIIIIGLVVFGIDRNQYDAMYQLMNVETLNERGDYEEVVDEASKGLTEPGDLEAPLLLQRSYAHIQLGEIDAAVNDLEKVVKLDATIPEAYYNLALLYDEKGDTKKAIKAARKAYDLKPNDERYKKLFEKITKEEAAS